MSFPILKAPFPWFGGKSRVAEEVWDRFGDVVNFVEPFAGSLAVLLGRPTSPQTETVNDIDAYLSNFWRSVRCGPAATAEWCDWPVNEADLHARHLWLVNQTEFRERMKTDPDFYDPKIAGWWVWGISQWIGGGWCSPGGQHHRQLASLGDGGRGTASVSLKRQMPILCHSGEGVHRETLSGPPAKRPHLAGHGPGKGIHGAKANATLYDYFEALAARLRRVRVCCGDWTRVLGPSVTIKHGVCGVFLDPPYDMRVVSNSDSGRDGAARSDGLYSSHDSDLSKAVAGWAVENGDNPLLRIAVCGYEGEHNFPDDWECVPWKAQGGYGSRSGSNENAARERIWFSPHCIRVQELLFR